LLFEVLREESGTDLQIGFRLEVAQSLAEIGLKDKTAVVPALVEVLTGENRRVCQAASAALKKLDPQASAKANRGKPFPCRSPGRIQERQRNNLPRKPPGIRFGEPQTMIDA
jgi:hypothetical protein